MNIILKHEFRDLALRERELLGLTQKQMAETLEMSERSYSDIESGASSCGALTIVLLLISIPDSEDFLQIIRQEFELLYVKEAI